MCANEFQNKDIDEIQHTLNIEDTSHHNLIDKMGTTENFCLRWNDFESNLSSAFRELRDDADFFDVTLATDEDEVKAHKVVLSACSPHLKQVIFLDIINWNESKLAVIE